MSPDTSPNVPPGSSPGFSIARAALLLTLTVGVAASSFVINEKAAGLIVPVAIGAGIYCALRRSFWFLVFFGYPFLFGLVSGWNHYVVMPGYEKTVAFAISIGIGLVGVVMVAVGLWLALPGRSDRETSVSSV
jgi:hypothetical protein